MERHYAWDGINVRIEAVYRAYFDNARPDGWGPKAREFYELTGENLHGQEYLSRGAMEALYPGALARWGRGSVRYFELEKDGYVVAESPDLEELGRGFGPVLSYDELRSTRPELLVAWIADDDSICDRYIGAERALMDAEDAIDAAEREG